MAKDQFFDFVVGPNEQGFRLDAVLSRFCPDISRSGCVRLIKDGCVFVDKAKKKPSYVVRPGERIFVRVPEPEPLDVVPEPVGFAIVYEDSDLVVVDKPAGLVVHPAPGHSHGTLVNGLLFHCNDLSGIGGIERPGIVHRLDKDTSGLLLVAKNDASHQALSEQFANRSIKKNYIALVHGIVKDDCGSIRLPIGRHPADRKKMSVHSRHPRDAHTDFRVRRRYEDASLLELDLKTGRTHQIRVHLAQMMHPVIGDPVYGPAKMQKKAPVSVRSMLPAPGRQYLHSWRVRFYHPSTGKVVDIRAPLPDDMRQMACALSRLQLT